MMMMMKVKLWTLSGKLIAVKISLNNELYPTRLAGWTVKMSEAMDVGVGPGPRPDGFANCALNYASIRPFRTPRAERVQRLMQVRRSRGPTRMNTN